jgi:hypothetical protein
VGKLKCEDFDKLIHLYFDGELDAEKSKEIEEHLLTCQKCAAKLQELENLADAAKRIRMPEPSSDYWKTFTERVRNEIILRRKKSVWARLKSGWESFFFYSPAKLRIAAGIASILLVFIIGKLYWDYKGKELERVRSERIERTLSVPAHQKPEYPSPALTESTKTGESTLIKPKPTATEPETVKVHAPLESIPSSSDKVIMEEKSTEAGEVKTQPPKPSVTSTLEVRKIDEKMAARLNLATKVEPAIPQPSVPETTIQIQKLQSEKGADQMNKKEAVSSKKIGEEFYPVELMKFYKVDETWVRSLTERDTSIDADTLKKVISTWKEFFSKKPVPEWVPGGFSQIKIAYQLLFLKNKDLSSLEEGIELLNKYNNPLTDWKTKHELNKKILELEALKKK